MLTHVIKQWDENKHKLEEYFRTHKQEEYSSYLSIVSKIFEYVIIYSEDKYSKYNHKDIVEIDNGDYQGTLFFIIHNSRYQPSLGDYLVTCVDYGSCSVCDTLQSIQEGGYDELPTDNTVSQYMTLALHLVQRMKFLCEDDR